MAQQRRRNSPGTKKPETLEWVYEHDDVRISELDFTTAMMEQLDDLTGMTYSVSFPTVSPKVMRYWLQVAFASRGIEDAEDRAARMTFRDCLARFKTVPLGDDLPIFGEKDDDGAVPTSGDDQKTA